MVWITHLSSSHPPLPFEGPFRAPLWLRVQCLNDQYMQSPGLVLNPYEHKLLFLETGSLSLTSLLPTILPVCGKQGGSRVLKFQGNHLVGNQCSCGCLVRVSLGAWNCLMCSGICKVPPKRMNGRLSWTPSGHRCKIQRIAGEWQH